MSGQIDKRDPQKVVESSVQHQPEAEGDEDEADADEVRHHLNCFRFRPSRGERRNDQSCDFGGEDEGSEVQRIEKAERAERSSEEGLRTKCLLIESQYEEDKARDRNDWPVERNGGADADVKRNREKSESRSACDGSGEKEQERLKKNGYELVSGDRIR